MFDIYPVVGIPMLINWTEFFWAIIWDLGAISWCLVIGGTLIHLRITKESLLNAIIFLLIGFLMGCMFEIYMFNNPIVILIERTIERYSI